MKENKIEIDTKMVEEKAREIGVILDGIKLPELFAILGNVIMECIFSAVNQGYDIRGLVSDWLDMLSSNVEDLDSDLDFGEEYEN